MTNPITLTLDLNDVALIQALLKREQELGPIDSTAAESDYQESVLRLMARLPAMP